MENPISTALMSLMFISDKDEGKNIELVAQTEEKNLFCQFERIELEESVNNLFPLGALIVRDNGDIVSYMAENEIHRIRVSFENGEIFDWWITSITYANNMASETDQNFVVVHFSNLLYKESQEASFYYRKASNPGQDRPWLWDIPYPFMTTPRHIVATYGLKKVFTPAISLGNGKPKKLGCGVNLFIKNTQDTVNYVLFKPRISDSVRREQFQTNIITYLNYIFSYAVNKDGLPYYLFWTDFSGSLNYKFFELETDLKTSAYSFSKPNTDPGHIQAYAIYDSHEPVRKLEIEGSTRDCRKIYVATTNPAYTYNKKNYYYIRETPVYMERHWSDAVGATADPNHLMSPFLPEINNLSNTVVTCRSVNTSPPAEVSSYSLDDQNLILLPDKGYYGYTRDIEDIQQKINSVDAFSAYQDVSALIDITPLGMLDSQNEDERTPIYPFNDNRYMWQYHYDLTYTHPNMYYTGGNNGRVAQEDFYEQVNSIVDSAEQSAQGIFNDQQIYRILQEDVTFNKVMEAKFTTLELNNVYDNEYHAFMEQVEKENFVSNVLCCMGEELIPSEEWFFALITGYAKDTRVITKQKSNGNNEVVVDFLKNAWLYSWKKLEPGPIIGGMTGATGPRNKELYGIPPGGTYHASLHSMFHGWTGSPCIGSTGSPSENNYEGDDNILPQGFGGIDTWAINLNERLNGAMIEGLNTENYIGPGYYSTNILSTFSVKPVGFTGQFYSGELMGTASHIVKMYRISVSKLRAMGCAVPAPVISDHSVYYFSVENAIDGAC